MSKKAFRAAVGKAIPPQSCSRTYTWTNDIAPMLAPYVACMNTAPPVNQRIDLSSYDAVKANAEAIYWAVQTGYMPTGGPQWTPAQVNMFGCWAQQGFPK